MTRLIELACWPYTTLYSLAIESFTLAVAIIFDLAEAAR